MPAVDHSRPSLDSTSARLFQERSCGLTSAARRSSPALGWRDDGNLENQDRFLLDFGAVFVRGICELKSSAIVSAERNATFAGLTSFRHPSPALLRGTRIPRCTPDMQYQHQRLFYNIICTRHHDSPLRSQVLNFASRVTNSEPDGQVRCLHWW
jgi:hypothetical protein